MLVVKKSRIRNAGKGLFTTSPIKKGDIIVEYKGEKMTWAECEKRNEKAKGNLAYFFHVSKNNCVDASATLDALARYANDADGKTKSKKYKNNSVYDIIKGKPYIVATKNIPKQSEIFVEYGKEYWESIETE